MAFSVFHGSVRKKLVCIVLFASLPIIILLTYTNIRHEADHVADSKKDVKIFLHGFTEIQRSITESTKTLLQTVAAMPEVHHGDEDRIRIVFQTVLKANPFFTNIIYLNARGDAVVMGKGKNKGFNFADRKQFQDAVSTKQFAFGEYVVGKATKKSIFPFAMPVLDTADKVIGVIIVGVSLEHYGELFRNSDFPKGSYFDLCDLNGNRLFRIPSSAETPIGEPLEPHLFSVVVETGAAGLTTVQNSDGVDRLVAFEPLRISPASSPYMYMMMGLDKEELLKEVHADFVQGIIISFMSVGIALLIAWSIGWKVIAAKLDKLAGYAVQVGKGGNVAASDEDYTDGELGQLFESFDTMAARLTQREVDLRHAKQVAEEANSALRLNMYHLRALLETMPELVWLKDVDGVYVFCNQRFEQFFGASEAEIVGKMDADFVSQELSDNFRARDMAVMEAKSSLVNEESVTFNSDGHVEHLETIKTPLLDQDGQLIGVLGVARDITQRKLTADKLKESELRFKTLHNASFGGISIHDKGVILDCNQGLVDVSGYSFDELIGMDGLLLIAEADRETVMTNIMAQHEAPYEVMGLRKNGEEYPLRLEARSLPYQGQFVRVVEFRDISEQKRAEDELRDSELRHRVIFENSPLGMVRFGDDGRILDCNDLFVDLMGATREELLGFNSMENSQPKMRAALGLALAGQPSSYEDYYTSVTGNKRTYLHVQFNPVNVGQSPTEVIATLEDFNERKLAQENLEKAKEEAEAFSHSKTEFLTNMSHEIRTPLNGILGMLQLMQQSGLSGEQRNFVADAIQSSQRLTKLLTDILDLSRVEAGKLAVQQVPFDIKKTCQEVCDLYRLAAEHSSVSLQLTMDPAIPRVVVGDSLRVQQVFTNLIGNAFKFTEKGRIDFTAQLTTPKAEEECRILFTVSDTGLGIPDDKLNDLFDSFTQVSNGYTREQQGAGLGLAICKQLVRLMDGGMSVETDVGVGTSVAVSIPFPVGSSDAVLESLPSDEELARTSRSLNVLLAEDERVNSLVTQRLLEKAGHTVFVVSNGKEALAAVQDGAFDLVLMDIQMPVMNGMAATEAIRSGKAGEAVKDIPIAAVTAYAMVGDREKFLAAGMDGYIVKPVELEKLQAFLKDVALSIKE